MFLAGQEIKNPLASELASAFRPFAPGIYQILSYHDAKILSRKNGCRRSIILIDINALKCYSHI